MSASPTAVEGPSLEETVARASEILGVPAEQIDWSLDRDHFANGADTVRIFASPKDPKNVEIAARLERFLVSELQERSVEAKVRATVQNSEIQIRIEAGPGAVPDDPEALAALAEVLREVVGDDLGERELHVRVHTAAPDSAPPRRPREPRRDRDDRRGGRDRDRDRGRGRGDRDGRRGERRGKPEKDPARDAALKEQAKEAVNEVLETEEPVIIEGLNSYERRIVHRVVAQQPGLTTRSVGDGSVKDVEIFFEDEDDFEDEDED